LLDNIPNTYQYSEESGERGCENAVITRLAFVAPCSHPFQNGNFGAEQIGALTESWPGIRNVRKGHISSFYSVLPLLFSVLPLKSPFPVPLEKSMVFVKVKDSEPTPITS